MKAGRTECCESHAESKLQCLESIICKGTTLYILWQAAVFINKLMGFCEKSPGNKLCRTSYCYRKYQVTFVAWLGCLSVCHSYKLHALTTQVYWCTAFQQHPGPMHQYPQNKTWHTTDTPSRSTGSSSAGVSINFTGQYRK